MTIFEIPLPQTNGREFTINTDMFGVRYQLRFFWNFRDSSWAFDLIAPDAVPIMQGARATINYDTLAQATDNRKPPGYLMFIDTSNRWQPPGINDLGQRVRLTYNDLVDNDTTI
jgi:hypothetical protein